MSAPALIVNRTGRVKAEAEIVPREAVIDEVIPLPGEGLWLYGRKVELGESDLTTPQKGAFWLACRALDTPTMIPTLEVLYTTRAQARAQCEDEMDYLMWMPLNVPARKRKESRKFYCVPVAEPELDERHAALFADEASYIQTAATLLAPLAVSERCQIVLDRLAEVERGVNSLEGRMKNLEGGRRGVGDLHPRADDIAVP